MMMQFSAVGVASVAVTIISSQHGNVIYGTAALVPVAYDMVDSSNVNLINHVNDWQGVFSSSFDGFEKYAQNSIYSIPKTLLDESVREDDTIGIIRSTDNFTFFGVADAGANSLPDPPVSATWEFNITGHTNLQVTIDAAAMGNFEADDEIWWKASIDEGPEQSLFTGVGATSLSVRYELEDGSYVDKDDPMSLDGVTLDNKFVTLNSFVFGEGHVLKLTLETTIHDCCEAVAFRNIVVLADNGGPSSAPTAQMTCPEVFCSSDIVTTMDPTGCDLSNVNLTSLATHEYNGDVLVELLGPADAADAAAIVLTAPHGGTLKPNYIADRESDNDDYCPSSGCRTSADGYTKELALEIQNMVMNNYCKVPYLIINHLHRSKLDANREIVEAAHGNCTAEDAWWSFHNYIADAQVLVKNSFGTIMGETGLNGVVGILFDVHGYAGTDWRDPDGSEFIQWGYRLSKDRLNTDSYCPVDQVAGTRTFTHAQTLPGQTLECLVRGPGSLGSRVAPLNAENCGVGLPSFNFPDVHQLANDCTYCDDICSDQEECNFYRGGYDVDVHQRMGWQDDSGDYFNTVQAEFPRCIRFNSGNRDAIAYDVSIALCSFLVDLFGSEAGTCSSATS